jgi:hypothetical protein
MSTQKPHSPLGMYLDLWNLLLILVGLAVVLLLRPFAGFP